MTLTKYYEKKFPQNYDKVLCLASYGFKAYLLCL